MQGANGPHFEQGVPIQCVVRVRPTESTGIAGGSGWKDIARNGDHVQVLSNSQLERAEARVDLCFGPESTNGEIYRNVVDPLVAKVCDGYNGALLLFGATGSGKSFTLEGTGRNLPGVVQLAIEGLFQQLIAKSKTLLLDARLASGRNPAGSYNFSVESSFLEICGDECRDLYNPSTDPALLRVLDDRWKGVHVARLSSKPAATSSQLLSSFLASRESRARAPPDASNPSSRTATIFSLTIEQSNVPSGTPGIPPTERLSSKLLFVELPGSEKLSADPELLRLREGPSANRGILAFGSQVRLLASPETREYMDPRASSLTHLLADALGGNSFTTVLATVMPGEPAVSSATLRHLGYLSGGGSSSGVGGQNNNGYIVAGASTYPVQNNDRVRALLRTLRARLLHAEESLQSNQTKGGGHSRIGAGLSTGGSAPGNLNPLLPGEAGRDANSLGGDNGNNSGGGGGDLEVAALQGRLLEERKERALALQERDGARYHVRQLKEMADRLLAEKEELQAALISSEEERLTIGRALIDAELMVNEAALDAAKTRAELEGRVLELEAEKMERGVAEGVDAGRAKRLEEEVRDLRARLAQAEAEGMADTRIREAAAKADARIREAAAEADARIREVEARVEGRIRDVEAKAEGSVREARAQVELMEKQVAEEKREAERRLAAAQEGARAELAAVTAKWESELARAKATAATEVADARAKAGAEIADIKARGDAEVEETRAKAEAQVAEAKARADAGIKEAERASGVAAEEARSSTRSLEEARATVERQLAELGEARGEIAAMRGERDAAKQQLEEVKREWEQAQEGYRAKLAGYAAQVGELARAVAITESDPDSHVLEPAQLAVTMRQLMAEIGAADAEHDERQAKELASLRRQLKQQTAAHEQLAAAHAQLKAKPVAPVPPPPAHLLPQGSNNPSSLSQPIVPSSLSSKSMRGEPGSPAAIGRNPGIILQDGDGPDGAGDVDGIGDGGALRRRCQQLEQQLLDARLELSRRGGGAGASGLNLSPALNLSPQDQQGLPPGSPFAGGGVLGGNFAGANGGNGGKLPGGGGDGGDGGDGLPYGDGQAHSIGMPASEGVIPPAVALLDKQQREYQQQQQQRQQLQHQKKELERLSAENEVLKEELESLRRGLGWGLAAKSQQQQPPPPQQQAATRAPTGDPSSSGPWQGDRSQMDKVAHPSDLAARPLQTNGQRQDSPQPVVAPNGQPSPQNRQREAWTSIPADGDAAGGPQGAGSGAARDVDMLASGEAAARGSGARDSSQPPGRKGAGQGQGYGDGVAGGSGELGSGLGGDGGLGQEAWGNFGGREVDMAKQAAEKEVELSRLTAERDQLKGQVAELQRAYESAGGRDGGGVAEMAATISRLRGQVAAMEKSVRAAMSMESLRVQVAEFTRGTQMELEREVAAYRGRATLAEEQLERMQEYTAKATLAYQKEIARLRGMLAPVDSGANAGLNGAVFGATVTLAAGNGHSGHGGPGAVAANADSRSSRRGSGSQGRQGPAPEGGHSDNNGYHSSSGAPSRKAHPDGGQGDRTGLATDSSSRMHQSDGAGADAEPGRLTAGSHRNSGSSSAQLSARLERSSSSKREASLSQPPPSETSDGITPAASNPASLPVNPRPTDKSPPPLPRPAKRLSQANGEAPGDLVTAGPDPPPGQPSSIGGGGAATGAGGGVAAFLERRASSKSGFEGGAVPARRLSVTDDGIIGATASGGGGSARGNHGSGMGSARGHGIGEGPGALQGAAGVAGAGAGAMQVPGSPGGGNEDLQPTRQPRVSAASSQQLLASGTQMSAGTTGLPERPGPQEPVPPGGLRARLAARKLSAGAEDAVAVPPFAATSGGPGGTPSLAPAATAGPGAPSIARPSGGVPARARSTSFTSSSPLQSRMGNPGAGGGRGRGRAGRQ
eukprot:jgi/Mesvir1/2985/Mv09609-RA.1